MEDKKDILNNKAKSFCEFLKKNNMSCTFTGEFTDINKTKIDFGSLGKAVLYYGKKGFTLTANELKDDDLKEKIKGFWSGYNGINSQSSTSQGINNEITSLYVDGSYLSETVGYGFAVINNNRVIYEDNGNITDSSIAKHGQVGGEIQAVISGLKWCSSNHISEVNIFYDYEGLEYWASGKWSAKKKITMNYRDYVQNSGITINWIKVKSHTNDRWNDYVDDLAKKGVKNVSNMTEKNIENQRETLSLEDLENFEKFLQNNSFSYKKEKKSDYQYRFQIKDAEKNSFIDFWVNNKGKSAKYQFAANMSSEMKAKLEFFWKNTTDTQKNPFASFEHYYSVLKYYSQYDFNFSLLANELNLIAIENQIEQISTNSSFEEINKQYQRLKGLLYADTL